MSNEIPRWADVELSERLPKICEKGESESVEFKEAIPDQSQKLAKELAAIGSSGGGSLFIGIDDNCEIVGLNLQNGDARDEFMERLQGIVQTVRPALNADLKFAFVSGKIVAVVQVSEQQAEPVFYMANCPYIRDRARSRPATPEEVKMLIWKHPSAEYARRLQDLEFEKKQNTFEQQKAHQEVMRDILKPRSYLRGQ